MKVTYKLGQKLIARATFTPGPPTEYRAWLRLPSGEEVEIPRGDIEVDGSALVVQLPVLREEGDYVLRVIGTEHAVGAEEVTFRVLNSRMQTPIP